MAAVPSTMLELDTPAPEPQRPSLGCNIKWRTGSEPEWFADA